MNSHKKDSINKLNVMDLTLGEVIKRWHDSNKV